MVAMPLEIVKNRSKNKGQVLDMDKIQVHPTGLISYKDKDVVERKKLHDSCFLELKH